MSVVLADELVLSLPDMKVFDSHIEALREGHQIGIQEVKTEAEIEEILADAEVYLEGLNRQEKGSVTTPDGSVFEKVPYEMLWLMEGDRFIGDLSFRLELTDLLRAFGGHIGYGIRPSLWGRGYATKMVELLKLRAKDKGMGRILVTCSPDNLASERVIIKCGGVFEDISDAPYGFHSTKRFWIELN